MPSRILREGIITSTRVNSLSWQAEVFYRRLMSIADDYGRYYAHPTLLKAALYPLQLEKVNDSDIGKWLLETEKAGLVRVYSVQASQYLEILDFRQQTRAKSSKYPCLSDAKQTHSKQISKCARIRISKSETDSESESNLPPPSATDAKTPSIHRELSDYFVEKWRGKYGKPYPFRKLDGIKSAELLKACGGSLDDARAVIDRYLADEGVFYNGHPLALLTAANNLPRFMVEPAKASGRFGKLSEAELDSIVEKARGGKE